MRLRNDDFTVVAGNNGAVTQSLTKTNLYRAGVGQPQAADSGNASGTTYCQQYAQSALFIAENEALFMGKTSPAPAVANNLFTFLANRFATSFGPGRPQTPCPASRKTFANYQQFRLWDALPYLM